MSRIETIVEIKRPLNEVFAYLSDLRTIKEWGKGIVEAEATSFRATGPGAVYRIVGLVAGRPVASVTTITEFDPGKMYASVSRMGPLVLDDRWEFTASGEATRVRQVTDFRAPGLLAPLGWIAARMLGGRLADDLRRAQRRMEADRRV